MLGRFFFVHRAQATRDDIRLETYEFLHATFGEYLVARFTWQVLRDIAAREAASTMSLSAAPVNDDLLHALLSFAVLSQRTPITGFLTDMAARLTPADQAALTGLLVRLFRVVHQQRSGRGFATYQPRPLSVPARHAAYSANLLLLVTCTAGSIHASELFGFETDVIIAWKNETMLWRSQLGPEEWGSICQALALHRIWNGDMRDLRFELDDGTFQEPPIDPFWTYDLPPSHPWRANAFEHSDHRPNVLHRKAHFLCRMGEDVSYHALEPLAAALGISISTIICWDPEVAFSAAHALLDTWLLPLREPTPEEQRITYERCARIATYDFPPWHESARIRYATLLLDRLTTDTTVPATLAAGILSQFETPVRGPSLLSGVASHVLRCALTFLGRDPNSDHRIAKVIHTVLALPDHGEAALALQARDRLNRLMGKTVKLGRMARCQGVRLLAWRRE